LAGLGPARRGSRSQCEQLSGWVLHVHDSLLSQTFQRARLGADVQGAPHCVGYEPLRDRDSRGLRRFEAVEAVGEREHLVSIGGDLPASDDDGRGADGWPRASCLGNDASQRPGKGATMSAALQLSGAYRQLRASSPVGSACQRSASRPTTTRRRTAAADREYRFRGRAGSRAPASP
jgi:hypothetical protein